MSNIRAVGSVRIRDPEVGVHSLRWTTISRILKDVSAAFSCIPGGVPAPQLKLKVAFKVAVPFPAYSAGTNPFNGYGLGQLKTVGQHNLTVDKQSLRNGRSWRSRGRGRPGRRASAPSGTGLGRCVYRSDGDSCQN